jgi:hypothetical protein
VPIELKHLRYAEVAERCGSFRKAADVLALKQWNERRRGHIAELRKRAAEAEAKLKRLYEAIENGVVDMADPSLKDRIAELTAVRDQAQADAERATSAVERLGPAITSDSLRRFALAARRKLRNTMELIGGTTCVRLPSAWKSSTRARFASSVRKPNCYGHLSPLRA